MVKEDAEEAAALIVASFENNAFRAIVLPNGMSQTSIDKVVQWRQRAIDDSNQYLLKVVDTDNNDKMAGCAVWECTKAMTNEDWERSKRDAPNAYPEARHDILGEFLIKEQDSKCRIMGHTRWLELNALNTLPAYQRRGVGSMLMKWGTDKLEEMKVPGFIVSTDQGYGLYIKHGFKEIERWETDLSRWQPGQGMYKNVFLTRMPSGYAALSS